MRLAIPGTARKAAAGDLILSAGGFIYLVLTDSTSGQATLLSHLGRRVLGPAPALIVLNGTVVSHFANKAAQ